MKIYAIIKVNINSDLLQKYTVIAEINTIKADSIELKFASLFLIKTLT